MTVQRFIRRATPPVALVLLLVLVLGFTSQGCSASSRGNRENDRPLVTRFTELRKSRDKEVTLIGTARAAAPGQDAAIDLRGGTVAIPAFDWPPGYADQPVSVTGRLFEERQDNGVRTYRLGEIKGASRWSR